MNVFIAYYGFLGASALGLVVLLVIFVHDLWAQRQARKQRRMALELHPFLWRPSREPRANVRRT